MGFCLEIIYNNLNENEYIGELKKKKSLIYNTFYSMEMAKKTLWDSW